MELEDIVNEEMLTIEDVNNMLEHTDKGRTKQTIRNCVTILQNDPRVPLLRPAQSNTYADKSPQQMPMTTPASTSVGKCTYRYRREKAIRAAST